jgi:hypothetical protein
LARSSRDSSFLLTFVLLILLLQAQHSTLP